MTTTQRTASLTIDGKTTEFPIMSGTHGNDVIDIRSLGGKTGLFTYDSGFLSTASCQSKVTYIDGDKGELLYRGYPIEQLAENCNFLEVTYLLKNGELPNATQKIDFENTIKRHTMVHEQLSKFYSEVCLLDQEFVKENSKKIKDLIKERGASLKSTIAVAKFIRFQIG